MLNQTYVCAVAGVTGCILILLLILKLISILSWSHIVGAIVGISSFSTSFVVPLSRADAVVERKLLDLGNKDIDSTSIGTSNKLDPWQKEVNEKYVIQPGDNFWKIAIENSNATESSIEFWRKIIKDNVSLIKSKNPNLIYPGEVISISHS